MSLPACVPSMSMGVPAKPVRKKTKAVKRWRAGVLPETLKVMSMTKVPVSVRDEAETLFHIGFGVTKSSDIQENLCLQDKPMTTRSGRMPQRRCSKNEAGTWLVWYTQASTMVGAAIVECVRGFAPSLKYITAKPKTGAGHQLVRAAENLVCNKLRRNTLFSAADLNQQGQAWGGQAKKSAVDAHRSWGFVEIQLDEWKKHCEHYYRGGGVAYMMKTLQ